MDQISNYSSLKNLKNKKIFITGHTGFKGSWLTYILLELGAEVCGYSLPPKTDHDHFNSLKLESKIKNIFSDIRDFDSLRNAISDFQPEIVFHLAAQPLVKLSYNDPINTYSTNVMGSVHLLESVKQCSSVKSLVFITSDKCYENLEWVWGYRENDRMGGYDPYSSSKGAAELVFSTYLRSYFNQNLNIGVASARAGNVIGGGDWSEDRIIPDCIRSINKNIPIEIRNPLATRPWQHVLEPLSGYLLLSCLLLEDPKKYSGSWNFGPNTTEVKTVKDVSDFMVQYFKKGSVFVKQDFNQQHEANLLQLNCDKAHQLLNWHPRWDVKTTLQNTAEWYKLFLENKNIEEVTKLQIKDYFKEVL